jgi:hypothetical protein
MSEIEIANRMNRRMADLIRRRNLLVCIPGIFKAAEAVHSVRRADLAGGGESVQATKRRSVFASVFPKRCFVPDYLHPELFPGSLFGDRILKAVVL